MLDALNFVVEMRVLDGLLLRLCRRYCCLEIKSFSFVGIGTVLIGGGVLSLTSVKGKSSKQLLSLPVLAGS